MASATGIQIATDPFTILENALWFALDTHPALQALVRVGNTVRFCTDKDVPQKQAVTDADMPELALMPYGCSANQKNTSSSGGVTQRYALAVTTGQLRSSGAPNKRAGLNQVKWACIRALARYRAGIKGVPFVVRVQVNDIPERIDAGASEDRRLPDGWSAVIGIECWLEFPWTEIET